MNARPYQTEAIEAIEAGFGNFRKQLLVLPTGGGKTCVFSWLAQRRQPQRTLILAHREELIDQAVAKLAAATGIRADREKAEHWASKTASVVVGSIQSLCRKARLERWAPDHFGLVVADEAHHCCSPTWQTVLKHFGSAQVLGVTATPDRSDKRNLGEYFENVAHEISLFTLIDQGYLSPISIKAIPLQIDLSNVGVKLGDFKDADLDHAITPYLSRIAQAIKEHAPGRRTLVFLPLINTSLKFVEACKACGLNAEHIDGTSPDRKEILARFADGEFEVLSNAMLLTEGFDDPGIDCVVVLRPTKSRPLYAQIVGRGTRTSFLKDDLLLLDFLWMHQKHPICRPAHLIAKDEEEAQSITELSQAKGCSDQLELRQLAADATHQREESLRKKLQANSRKQGKFISSEEYAMQHDSLAVAEYQPEMAWERQPITEPQARALSRAKIDVETVRGKGHASKLLDIVFRNRKVTLAGAKAVELMRRMPHICAEAGITNLEQPTSADAGRFFAQLKKRRTAA